MGRQARLVDKVTMAFSASVRRMTGISSKGDFMLTFDYHGVELSPSDFPRDLQGWVAFSIAMAFNTRCRDKDAALELLLHEADKIIEQVKTGKAPV